MVSDDSLTGLDDSYFDIYSTKTITSTYYSFLEKLKSGNNASGNRTIVERDQEENRPCTSTNPSGSHINLNDPCTSKDTRRSHVISDEPCTSDSDESSIIIDDSSGSTIISNNPCTLNEPSRNSPVLAEENDLEVVPNNPSTSTPVVPFTRIRLRRRTGRRRRGRGRGRGRETGRGTGIGTGTEPGMEIGTGTEPGMEIGTGTEPGMEIGTGTEPGIGTGTGTEPEPGTSGSGQQTSEVEIIEVSPVAKRKRIQQIPEVVELSDDDDSMDPNLTLEDEINYEVSVKVLWMSVTVKTFRLRRFQKFTSVFEYFMKEENVPYENILLKLRGIKITNNDTPDSLDLKVCDFIDGGILSEAMVSGKHTEPMRSITNNENCLTIKLQDKTKIVHRLTINKGEMMKLLMVKYAEQTEIPLKKLKFYYDGEIVNPSDTPDSLGISNGEIIDVKY